MKAKIFSIILSVILTASLSISLVGCGGNKSVADNQNLVIMADSGNVTNVYLQKIFDLYKQKTGESIDIVEVPNKTFNDDVHKMYNNGEGADILMHFNNAPLEEFNPTENFYDLSNESWVNELTTTAKSYSMIDNKLIGLPFWENSTSGCYYNKTILDKLGLSPAKTQKEFNALCASLKEAGYTPLSWGNVTHLLQFGLDPIFANNIALLEKVNSGEIELKDIPEVVEVIKWIDMACQKGWFGKYKKNI